MEKELTLLEKFQIVDSRWYCSGCTYSFCDCCKIRQYAVDIMKALRDYEKIQKGE